MDEQKMLVTKKNIRYDSISRKHKERRNQNGGQSIGFLWVNQEWYQNEHSQAVFLICLQIK